MKNYFFAFVQPETLKRIGKDLGQLKESSITETQYASILMNAILERGMQEMCFCMPEDDLVDCLQELKLSKTSYLSKEMMEEALIRQYQRSNYDPSFFAFFSDEVLEKMGKSLCLNENWSKFLSSEEMQHTIFLETVKLALEMLLKKLNKKTLKSIQKDLGICETGGNILTLVPQIVERYFQSSI